jgi:transposase
MAMFFVAYLEHVLCPRLQPGDIVVMDNLFAHKVQGVRQLISACGAELLYLRPTLPTSIPLSNAGPISN